MIVLRATGVVMRKLLDDGLQVGGRRTCASFSSLNFDRQNMGHRLTTTVNKDTSIIMGKSRNFT